MGRRASERCCERCRPLVENLEEEIAYLRSEVGLAIEAAKETTLMQEFGLSGQGARLLLILFSLRKDAVLSPHQLDDFLPICRVDHRAYNTISVYAHKLRQALGSDSVESTRGRGYRLTEKGRNQVAKTLAEAAA